MASARVAAILSVAWLTLGCDDGVAALVRASGNATIREIPADEARRAAARGARLLQPVPLASDEVRVVSAERVPAGRDPQSAEGPIVVLGSGPSAWKLAARLQRAGAGPISIAPAGAEDWVRPQAAWTPPDE